jgi:DNA-binding transcriptional MerR regulator
MPKKIDHRIRSLIDNATSLEFLKGFSQGILDAIEDRSTEGFMTPDVGQWNSAYYGEWIDQYDGDRADRIFKSLVSPEIDITIGDTHMLKVGGSLEEIKKLLDSDQSGEALIVLCYEDEEGVYHRMTLDDYKNLAKAPERSLDKEVFHALNEHIQNSHDADKLRTLADWLDMKYPSENKEVQEDLRRIADQVDGKEK